MLELNNKVSTDYMYLMIEAQRPQSSILRKCDNCSVSLFSDGNMNSTVVSFCQQNYHYFV